MIPKRVLLTIMDYDPELKAKVVPWAHRLHAWVGLVYVFDDPEVQDILLYMTSNWNGDHEVHIMQCHANVHVNDDGTMNVSLDTNPDPDTDKCIRQFKLKLPGQP